MQYIRQYSGFTLIEIVVVISLLSITLLFVVPRFPSSLIIDDSKKTSRWIIANVQTLKESAVRDQQLYTLHISLDNKRLWITNESMNDDELQSAQREGFQLPGNVRVLDVEYPNNKIISFGQAKIDFYRKGYSDRAMIHVADVEKRLSFQIESFLSTVKLHEKYISFDNSPL
jgi:prepilin-type N-terminal cleavage/methylation domain-containing protein